MFFSTLAYINPSQFVQTPQIKDLGALFVEKYGPRVKKLVVKSKGKPPYFIQYQLEVSAFLLTLRIKSKDQETLLSYSIEKKELTLNGKLAFPEHYERFFKKVLDISKDIDTHKAQVFKELKEV